MNTRFIRQAAALTAIICAGGAQAEDTVEARLQKLETTVETLRAENDRLRDQMGWDGTSALNHVEHAGKASSISVGGYFQAQAGFGGAPDARFNGNRENDGFTIRRARVSVSGDVAENFDFKIMTDLGGYGSGLRSQLTDGYLNWNRHDFANVKIGQFKTPFGFEQLEADTKTLTIERSLPNDRLTFGRQIGVAVSGEVVADRLNYSAGVFNGNNVNIGVNDSDNFMLAGRLEGNVITTRVGEHDLKWNAGLNGVWSDDTASSIGGFGFRNAAGLASANNVFAGTRAGFGVDSQLTWWRFGLRGELLWVNFQPDNGNFTAATADDDFDSVGGYVAATFDVLPKKLQALVKFETLDTDGGVGTGDGDVITLGVNYFVHGDNLKLSANYLMGDRDGADADSENRLLLRAQVAF